LTLSFGLVAIPLKLYSATVSSERISFNLLRAKDGSRVKQQSLAVNDGKIVERVEMTKGYEFAKDQYVILSPQEIKQSTVKPSMPARFYPLIWRFSSRI
jgi:DNA end-binding protein Ku